MKIGNLEVYGVIYKITNKVNNKVYIGQTMYGFNARYCKKGTGIERVYKHHKSLKDNGYLFNEHLLNSIEKYGFKNFEITEVYDVAFSRYELDLKEVVYISLYNSANGDFGYNRDLGGSDYKGKGTRYNCVKVICLNTLKEYNSILEAHEDTGCKKGTISNCCRGECNRALDKNGDQLTFAYYDDYINMTKEDVEYLIYKTTDEYRREVLSKAHEGKMPYRGRRIKCLNTGEIFDSIIDAIAKYNCSGLYGCLKNRTKSAGRHPVTNEKLRWVYCD